MRYAFFAPFILLGACVSNDVSVTIDRFAALTQDNMCLADPGGTSTSGGVLDVAAAQIARAGYFAAPIVGNHMTDRSGTTGVQLDAIIVQGFDIQITGDPRTAGALGLGTAFFTPAASVRIEPDSEAGVIVEVIPAQVATMLAGVSAPAGQSLPIVLVKLRPVYSHAGATSNGPWAQFPVSICSSCLLACPAGMPTATKSCMAQQDIVNNCCISNGTIVCPTA
jgi:hypothetical protein